MLPFRGILNDWQRSRTRHTVESLLAEAVYVLVPTHIDCTAPGCGYEPYLNGARNPSCVACGGLGRITTWSQAMVRGRVSWVLADRIINWQGISSGELGDCAIQVALPHKPIFERAKETDGAYVLLNGKRLKPVAIMENRVESTTSLDVRCKVITDGKE